MKKNIKTVIAILTITLIGVWIVSRIPFATKINQIVMGNVYIDGSAVQETAVNMNGVRSNYLFADDQYFNGQFYIEYSERTGRKDMNASITWHKNQGSQSILYYQNATFPSLEINYDIMINEKMNVFAIGLADGTIIATSDEMYQNYIENFGQQNESEVKD